MTVWRSFGASVVGPGHIESGLPNQDAWAAFHHDWGDVIVVSDGLGSKPYSDFGSRAACLAVALTMRTHASESKIDCVKASDDIRTKWISLLAPLDPRDCAATCLFAFRRQDEPLLIGMLGDGLIAAVNRDGSIKTHTEDKNDGFSNVTSALSTEVRPNAWRWLTAAQAECQAILLCSDGVADDLSDSAGFVSGFYEAHRTLAAVSASRQIRYMLHNWPTPKHSDDKTIACLHQEEQENE